MRRQLRKVITAITAITILLVPPALSAAPDEDTALALLKSPTSTLAQKQDACRQLARVGSSQSVPVLAGLLADPQLSHMARYALEPIPDPAADAALRDALTTVKGELLVGVINSIGVRKDDQAISALDQLLVAPDAEVAGAAALSLGSISTYEASLALLSKIPDIDATRFPAFSEGLLRCAESLGAQARKKQALEIYGLLWESPHSTPQVRSAALRGTVLTPVQPDLPSLLAVLQGPDDAMFRTAIRVSMDAPGSEVTLALAGQLPKLSPERQVLIVQSLGQRGDPGAGPALMALIESADPPVGVAAVHALARLAHPPAVPVLATLAQSARGELTAAARVSLAGFPDATADAAITQLLQDPAPEVRILGAGMLAQRDPAIALPVLLETATSDREEQVRVAALQVLRDMAGPQDLPRLLQILLKTSSRAVTQSVTHAIIAVCARNAPENGDPSPAIVDPLVAAMAQSSGPARTALLQILGRVGGAKADAAVRDASAPGEAP